MKRIWFAAMALVACGAFGSDVEAARTVSDAPATGRFRFLPFYEQRFVDDASFYAVRPFYSQVRDPLSDTRVYDVLWPLATSHSHDGASWWRALNLYGDRRFDADDNTLSYSFSFFPLWFNGRTREGESYWGLFPFYGHHPHFALMDDVTFVLWPFYMDYSVKGVRSHVVLWPFISWKDEPRQSVGVWPFYGRAHLRESDHSYCLWPFFTWASYAEDRDTSGAGSSWMAFPFYGRVNRARERQHLVLPPFFSYAETDVMRRWRLPWPLVDVEVGRSRDRVSVWPLYERINGYPFSAKGAAKPAPEEHTWRLGWKLVERTRLETDRTLEKRFSLFPFYTDEDLWTKNGGADSALSETPVASYFRLWPFYASATENGVTRRRVLELSPIRHSGGTERNWSPFWTFYSNETGADGATRHTLLWGLIKFTTGD